MARAEWQPGLPDPPSITLANPSNIIDDKLAHKIEKSHGLQAGTILWEQEHPSLIFTIAIKYRATLGKSVTIVVAFADANVFMSKHCPACLINGMPRKMPASLGLNPMAENISCYK